MTTAAQDARRRAEDARSELMRSMASGDWPRAERMIVDVKAAYDDAIEACDPSSDVDPALLEGRALCEVHEADLAIRHWRITDAEGCLDRAYAVLKKGSTEAELWRVTARIAERRGRWSSARAAWKKVVKLARGSHEGVVADALLRLADIALNEHRPDKDEDYLQEVRELALDDRLVKIRMEMVLADRLAMEGDVDGAMDAWKEMSRDLTGLPQDFVALLNLRRAGAEVHRAPVAAVRRILRGATLLHRLKFPDALGVAYGQLSVVGMALKRPLIAALAAVGANAARDGDTVAHALLAAAVKGAALDIRVEGSEGHHLQEALVGQLSQPARELGIAWSDLGSLKGLEKLAEPLMKVSTAGVRVDVESGRVVHSADLVGHRSSLAWDAPLGVLRTVVLKAPVLAPRRPMMYQPATPNIERPLGIQATPPPAKPRKQRLENSELRLITVATSMAVGGFAGLALLAMWGLFMSKQPHSVASPPKQEVEEEVPSPVLASFEVREDVGTGERIPVKFTTIGAATLTEITGQGLSLMWTRGSAELRMPLGRYEVRVDGQSSSILLDQSTCRIRRVETIVVSSCQPLEPEP